LNEIRFIDLFAGIGGTRLGFEQACKELNVPCKNVFTSEWDKYSKITYEANFGERPVGNIREIVSSEIRKHNVLLAGFPCQPFSIAGVSKKNALNRPHGFACEHQGNLFFEIERIIKDKQPDAFLLENVKHLKRHDKGRTYQVILDILKNKLKYKVFDRVYDAQLVVPQHRERIFIVGFRNKRVADRFQFPEIEDKHPKLGDILEKRVDSKYTLTDHLWDYLQKYKEKHQEKGNGFGFSLFGPSDIARTLSARYYKDGAEVLIKQKGKNPRRLTPKECCLLMGFPPDFNIPVSDTQAYRQFGNSICVPIVTTVAKELIRALKPKVN
jgi:DNA (cytosine-5)-methyltransferase 1